MQCVEKCYMCTLGMCIYFLCLHMNMNFELEQAYHSFSDEFSLHSNSNFVQIFLLIYTSFSGFIGYDISLIEVITRFYSTSYD